MNDTMTSPWMRVSDGTKIQYGCFQLSHETSNNGFIYSICMPNSTRCAGMVNGDVISNG